MVLPSKTRSPDFSTSSVGRQASSKSRLAAALPFWQEVSPQPKHFLSSDITVDSTVGLCMAPLLVRQKGSDLDRCIKGSEQLMPRSWMDNTTTLRCTLGPLVVDFRVSAFLVVDFGVSVFFVFDCRVSVFFLRVPQP